jgi:hypothetical protein
MTKPSYHLWYHYYNINIFGGKKTSAYLKKSFNQKSNLDNTKKRIIQFKIKNIIPIKIAFQPKVSFFTNLVIIPKNTVKSVKHNDIKNKLLKFNGNQKFSGGILDDKIKTKIASIVTKIITIYAKIKDILPNKLCFFISNLNLNHIIELKHYIKNIGCKKTSEHLDYEATLSTSRLLHWGQVNLKLLFPTYVSFGVSKRALQFLQWNRLIYFIVLLIRVIYSALIYHSININIISIYIIIVNKYWLKQAII